MPKIVDLAEATGFGVAEFMVIETGSGTRKITKTNSWPRRSEVPVLLDTDLVIDNDRVLIFDGTDGLLKTVSVRNLIFGDLNNQGETNDFTLQPGLHNVRVVQCTGTFATGTITLDGNLAIAGCNFTIANFSTGNITVVPTGGVGLRVDGVSATGGLIRVNRMASIVVSNGGGIAIFEGG